MMVASRVPFRPAPRERLLRRQRMAHGRLCEWAEQRDVALLSCGWPTVSIAARMDGCPSSTAPCELDAVESAVDRSGRILTMERLVRALPMEWRDVVWLRYVGHMPMQAIATELEIDRVHATFRLKDAQISIATALDAFRGPQAADELA